MDGGRALRHVGAVRLVVVLTAGVVGMGGLSACTGKDGTPQPTTTKPSAGPTTASPSPTATPPTAPKAQPTAKSAEAFVKYFWDVHNYAYATLDVEAFKSISASECTFCSSTAEDIRALRQAGTQTEGSFIRLVVAVAPPSKITTGIIVATVISQDPGRAIRSDGTVRIVPAMTKRQAHVSLNWTGDRWLVDDVAIDKSGKAS